MLFSLKMTPLLPKAVFSRCRAVAVQQGLASTRSRSAVSSEIGALRRQLDTTRIEGTARLDMLMNKMIDQSAQTSKALLDQSAQTSSRFDKLLAALLVALGFVGVYLESKLERKIEAGNAQLERKIEGLDHRIDAGNAQLKEDLVKTLKGRFWG
jgi:hypothetical protein